MLDIQEQIINCNKSVRYVSPQYIVIHDTGDAGGTAQNEHDYFSGGDRQASADFFVDDNNIIQIIDTDSYYSWHCGDGGGKYGIKNSNSLGIEMCLQKDGTISETTEQNTLELVMCLINKYNIPIDRVVRHYDASRKSCPNAMSSNNWSRWWNFKDKLSNGNVSDGKWISEDNKWWYQNSDGTYPRDCWKKINNKWFLFDESGWMLYDWKFDEGKWYYLGTSNDGSMKTGWLLKDSKWYYLDDSGIMITGWKQISGDWHFFNPSGEMQVNWFKDDKDNDYMAYSTGQLVTNCQYSGYAFDKDGHPTKL